jgi:hypothetical protein
MLLLCKPTVLTMLLTTLLDSLSLLRSLWDEGPWLLEWLSDSVRNGSFNTNLRNGSEWLSPLLPCRLCLGGSSSCCGGSWLFLHLEVDVAFYVVFRADLEVNHHVSAVVELQFCIPLYILANGLSALVKTRFCVGLKHSNSLRAQLKDTVLPILILSVAGLGEATIPVLPVAAHLCQWRRNSSCVPHQKQLYVGDLRVLVAKQLESTTGLLPFLA